MSATNRDLKTICSHCGQPRAYHGAVDGRCPGEKVGGEWIPAETFFKAVEQSPEHQQ